MTTIALGNLIGVLLTEVGAALEQSGQPAAVRQQRTATAALALAGDLPSVQVAALDLDLPAHLQVQADPHAPTGTVRLLVTLPSPLEQPVAGRVGRLRLTIEPEQPTSPTWSLH